MTMSKREKLTELQERLAQAEFEAQKYYNFEQAVKLMLNSIYGAFGNEWFYFFNVDIAETITLQGQDAILYTEKMINKYFQEYWSKDKEVHQKMGISVKGEVKKPVVIYIDTDSCYLSFQEVLENCDWSGSEKDFVLNLYEHRLSDFNVKILEKYAKDLNADNFLNFELETVAKNAIWLAKKKYMQNVVWKDPDIHYEPLTKISAKGFEIIQSSTPLFARNKLKEVLKFIFSVEKVELGEVVNLLKKLKREFKLANTEHITFNVRINNYRKYILSDYDQFEIASGCPIHIRAAGYYNYLLNNSKYKNRYKTLTDGEKIKYYISKDKTCNVFAFPPGDFPLEFAPSVDHDLQFERCIIDPINRVIDAMGLGKLDRNLVYSASVF
jgi:DNA polymerase elongation subunit (family B)